ncbi:MAG: TRAP transporter small permease [Geminicoccaceae bacterium]
MMIGRDSRIVHLATRLLRAISATTLFGLMLLTCVDVIGRYLFNHPIQGATEVTMMGMGLIVFSAMPVFTFHGGHVAVDLFDPLFRGTAQRVRDLVIGIVSAFVLAVIAWRVGILADRAFSYGDMTPYLRIPRWPLVATISFMSALAAVAALLKAVQDWRGEPWPRSKGAG